MALDDVGYSSAADAVVVPYARDHVSDAPAYVEDADLSDQDEERIYRHYGRPGYWQEVCAKQTTPSPTPEIAEADVAEARARGGDALRDDIGALSEEHDRLGRRGPRGVRRHDW